jgi:hypothetical protein
MSKVIINSAWRFLTGAGLGAFLAFSVIVANEAVWNMFVSSPSPSLAVLTFVALPTSLIGVGCAITGVIFDLVESASQA